MIYNHRRRLTDMLSKQDVRQDWWLSNNDVQHYSNVGLIAPVTVTYTGPSWRLSASNLRRLARQETSSPAQFSAWHSGACPRPSNSTGIAAMIIIDNL